MRIRLPRHERSRFRALPLPFWLRIVANGVGWLLVLLGIVGLFLPILQGTLSLALGFALLSISSQWFHLKLRGWMGRWPRVWKKMERLRRRMHGWLHRSRASAPPPAEP